MTLLVTCGPAWEPVDGMRRLTNASTGRLGARLGDALAEAGHRVVVCRGETATAPPPVKVAEVLSFGTNDALVARLEELAARERVDAVFHAAALCDFRVARIVGPGEGAMQDAKISSRAGPVRLELEPATKVLPRLRGWFPQARIVGWKFELNGTREDALAAAWRQLGEAGTAACVLNGTAWGEGFAWCEPPAGVTPYPSPEALLEGIRCWLERL